LGLERVERRLAAILAADVRARTFMLHSMPVSVMMPSLIGAC
jgi:hypothetical protein